MRTKHLMLAVAVAAVAPLSTSCACSGDLRAAVDRDAVRISMSSEHVRAHVGEPTRIAGSEGTEAWSYPNRSFEWPSSAWLLPRCTEGPEDLVLFEGHVVTAMRLDGVWTPPDGGDRRDLTK